MSLLTVFVLIVTMVLVAGCAGTFSGQSTMTSTATSTTDHTNTVTKTSTNISTTINNKSYTLFAGGSTESKANLGPRTFIEGQPVTAHLEINNREGHQINYTAVIQIARFNATGPNGTITNRWTLDQFTTTVKAGEQQLITRNVTPNITGQKLLLGFLLYKSDPPATPTFDNSYKYFAIPVNVTSPPTQENEPASQS